MRLVQYILDHWQGRLPLPFILLNLIGFSIGLTLFTGTPSSPVNWLISVAVLFLAVWQIFGSYRFSEHRMHDTGGGFDVWAIYGAIVVVVALTFGRIVGLLLPLSNVPLHLAQHAPKVTIQGGDIHVSGEIDYRMLTELKAVVLKKPTLRRVVLTSSGGHPIAGRAIGLFILEKGLSTHVEGMCFSACTLAFAGGETRSVGRDAQLGFHGYQFDFANRVQTLDVDTIEQKDRAYLAAQGFATEFILQIYATPPSALWQPSRSQLQNSGVLVEPVQ